MLKFSLILKGDLLTCIAMVQCDLDSTVGIKITITIIIVVIIQSSVNTCFEASSKIGRFSSG